MINEHTITNLNLVYKENILFYEKVFASLNAIVFVFDLNQFRIVWASEGFKKLLGYKKSTRKLPKSVLIDIYHPDDRNLLNEMKKFFKNSTDDKTFTGVYQFRDINGKYIWLTTVCNVFRRNEDLSVFEIVGVSVSLSNEITYDKNLQIFSRLKMKENNHETLKLLTRRENQIIKFFANGYKTKEVADILGLSHHTVSNHRKNIMKKLGVSNLAAMVNFATENGLS
jgi:PAS domain S-box-containing protein